MRKAAWFMISFLVCPLFVALSGQYITAHFRIPEEYANYLPDMFEISLILLFLSILLLVWSKIVDCRSTKKERKTIKRIINAVDNVIGGTKLRISKDETKVEVQIRPGENIAIELSDRFMESFKFLDTKISENKK